jgi:hypothetical protein
MTMVKVTGTNFVRDTNSMGLSNINSMEKNEYYSKVRMVSLQKQEINNVKSEIADVKSEMQEIKQLLLKLLEGSNG